MKSDAMLCLKENLIKARKQAGLTQEELAEQVCVSRSSISKWETGKKTPSLDNLAELAIVLGVSADYLLGLNEGTESEEYGMRFSYEAKTALDAFVKIIQKETRNSCKIGGTENDLEQKENFR